MSPAKQLSVANPSLGTLERLPGESRNASYQLAIETEHEVEADFHGPCRQRQSLHMVSKQIHHETKDYLQAMKSRPCQHTNFSITVFPFANPHPMPTAHTIDPKGLTVRFVTGHLAGDAPLAVTCHLRLPKSTCEIFGASEESTEVVYKEVTFLMGVTTMKIRTMGNRGFCPLDVVNLEKRLSDVAIWQMDF